jgi:hypothetical protein
MAEHRAEIVRTFAGWTALSALRSGAPIKSGRDIYPLLAAVDFDAILTGTQPIGRSEFDNWHAAALTNLLRQEPRLCVGWGAKLVNVYLKTTSYVGGLGRPGLPESLHPPIDGGLWSGLRNRFPGRSDILDLANAVNTIRDIRSIETYLTIVEGFRLAAGELGCLLIEVEQLWDGARAGSR